MKNVIRFLPMALLALPLALAAPRAEAAPPGLTLAPESALPRMVEPAQYYRERRPVYRPVRRCWTEMRPVRVRDAYGRIFVQYRPVRFCR